MHDHRNDTHWFHKELKFSNQFSSKHLCSIAVESKMWSSQWKLVLPVSKKKDKNATIIASIILIYPYVLYVSISYTDPHTHIRTPLAKMRWYLDFFQNYKIKVLVYVSIKDNWQWIDYSYWWMTFIYEFIILSKSALFHAKV